MRQSNYIDILVFKIFVFTLSLGRFIKLPFGDSFQTIVPQFSTIVMFIGFALLMLKSAKVVDNNVRPFVKFWLFSLIYTVLACSLLQILYILGFADGIDSRAWNLEVPYRAIMRDIVFWLYSIMALLYSYYNLRYNISFSELRGVIEASIIAILFVGLLQFGILNGVGGCSDVYIGLSSIFNLVDLNDISMLERGICFWGSEPSSASALCMFIVPYSIIMFLKSSGWLKMRFGIYLLGLFFLMHNSGSSSTVITSLLVIFCTIIYMLKREVPTWLYLAAFFIGFTVVTLYTIDIKIQTDVTDTETDSIEYVILGKLLDKENASTAMRVSTVCNDMKIFASYPLTGIGNGCQGYFYNNNIPEWTKFSTEVQSLMHYENGSISNGGGNFFVSYISGYGLIGVFILILLIRQYRFRFKNSIVNHDPILNFTFAVCIIVFLLAGWYVQSIEDNKLMFMLALGCVPYAGTK